MKRCDHMSKLLFVYGTLMQGMRNHSYMEKGKFIGSTQTKNGYELMYNGSIPAAREGGSDAIKGEMYEVEDEVLDQLDIIEGVQVDLYERKDIEVDGKEAVIYLGGEKMFSSDSWERVPDGDFRAYIERKSTS